MRHVTYIDLANEMLHARWGPDQDYRDDEDAIKHATHEQKTIGIGLAILAELRVISQPIKDAEEQADREFREKQAEDILARISVKVLLYGPAHRRLRQALLRAVQSYIYGSARFPWKIDTLLTIPQSKWTTEQLVKVDGVGEKTAVAVITEWQNHA